MPWARLHAAKDYVHMAELVADYPIIHCTFNYVPSLADQVVAIGSGEYEDLWQNLSLREAWSTLDKQWLLDHFFSIHPRLLERYPAYVRLRERRAAPETLPDQYFLDLAAWFNLAWIDGRAIARDATLSALVEKGENFTRADIDAILTRHRALAARVLPIHRELAARGQIEISVSPYYHPILPLLIDQRSARQTVAKIALPETLFAHPEDADEQVRRAVLSHRRHFGADPAGLWPSEGSVSAALLGLLGGHFCWLATDENILARSLNTAIERDADGNVSRPRVLYQPYIAQAAAPERSARPANKFSLIFRDHVLSDRIGFAYQYLPAPEAARDLIGRLHLIRERLADPNHAYLVSIILDGENAWESYEDNGDPFFRELYGALSNDPWLRTVTVSEYLQENPPRQTLSSLAAGSWINGNFDTWIGEPAHNRAWELLADTRNELIKWLHDYDLAADDAIARAWDELYIAEGSDWFWWYSSRNQSTQDALFDELFRGHLQNVYAAIGHPVPDAIKTPIRKAAAGAETRAVTAPISPSLAAAAASAPEWTGAGIIAPQTAGGTMQRAETVLSRVLYGYDAAELYFRIEANVDLTPYRLSLFLSTPRAERFNTRPRDVATSLDASLAWEIAVEPNRPQGGAAVQVYHAGGQELWQTQWVGIRSAVRDRVVELALLIRDLRILPGDALGVVVALIDPATRALVDRLPAAGLQSFILDHS